MALAVLHPRGLAGCNHRIRHHAGQRTQVYHIPGPRATPATQKILKSYQQSRPAVASPPAPPFAPGPNSTAQAVRNIADRLTPRRRASSLNSSATSPGTAIDVQPWPPLIVPRRCHTILAAMLRVRLNSSGVGFRLLVQHGRASASAPVIHPSVQAQKKGRTICHFWHDLHFFLMPPL